MNGIVVTARHRRFGALCGLLVWVNLAATAVLAVAYLGLPGWVYPIAVGAVALNPLAALAAAGMCILTYAAWSPASPDLDPDYEDERPTALEASR